MTTEATDRYARQRLVAGWNQERLAAATAVVVGVGALGNEVAKNLTLAGVGHLILCDPDTVSASNLSRSVLFRAADLGLAKTEAAKTELTRMSRGVKVDCRRSELTSGVGLGELADADVVMGCLDNRRARLQLLGRCALAGAHLVDGGTDPWGGEIRLRFSRADPCYGCSLTPAQRGESDVPWRCQDASQELPPAATIAGTALVAAWMTGAALRAVLGQTPPYRFIRIDGKDGESSPVTVTRDPGCPLHHPMGEVERVPFGHRATVDAFLAVLPDDADPLTWTEFPLTADCRGCGRRHPRDEIHARAMTCHECGGIVRPRFSQRLRDAMGEPDLRLSHLGVAPQEIIAVRLPGGEFRWLRLSR
ncbi:ThiF family adenylyltransferase [Streptosporangiaceae bacterium NEAU-GS5]|nr:ThiF family adenylyltransferase [Streptosporangiaceae bacterium NEAU-GS5]